MPKKIENIEGGKKKRGRKPGSSKSTKSTKSTKSNDVDTVKIYDKYGNYTNKIIDVCNTIETDQNLALSTTSPFVNPYAITPFVLSGTDSNYTKNINGSQYTQEGQNEISIPSQYHIPDYVNTTGGAYPGFNNGGYTGGNLVEMFSPNMEADTKALYDMMNGGKKPRGAPRKPRALKKPASKKPRKTLSKTPSKKPKKPRAPKKK